MSETTYDVAGMTCGALRRGRHRARSRRRRRGASMSSVEAGTGLRRRHGLRRRAGRCRRRRGRLHAGLTADRSTHVTATPDPSVDLLVGGMTCASCVARVEKKLNRLDGVEASRQPRDRVGAGQLRPGLVDEDTLVETVERTGYTATLPSEADAEAADEEAPGRRGLPRRLLVAAPLTVPCWCSRWCRGSPRLPWLLALLLTAPVVLYAGWPFHRAAAVNARHLASTMDTLVSLGTLVASAGRWCRPSPAGCTPTSRSPRPSPPSCCSAAAEARAKPRAGSALRALLELGAKRPPCSRTGTERLVDLAAATGDAHARPARRQVPTDGSWSRARAARRVDGHRREPAGREAASATRSSGHPERRRPAGRRGHPDRPRHPVARIPVGADAQSAKARPAAGRPDLGRVRAGRAGDGGATFAGWALTGDGTDGPHRGGGRAGDRLPVRPRPGHPDRAAGRHRARRPARHRDPRRRGAGVLPRGSTPSSSTRPAPSRPAG